MAIPVELFRAQQAAKKKKARPAGTTPAGLFVLLCQAELGHTPEPEHRFHPVRKWRFDFAFPDRKVALEVEGGVWTGGRHTRPAGFLKDLDKYNNAAAAGWLVFRCTPDTLRTAATLDLLRAALTYRG